MIYTLSSGVEILIDREDLPLLMSYNWQSNNGYIFRSEQENGVRRRFYLHRELVNPPGDKVVDHINGNPKDNRRINLRVCSHKENIRNRRKPNSGILSKYKGVKPVSGKFESAIGKGDSYVYIGSFKTEIEAAIAYNDKASEIYGEFANLNTIPDEFKHIRPVPYVGTSKYRGVVFHKRVGKWQTSIQHNKRRVHLGYFDCEHEAAKQYNEEALKLRGNKAKLNVIKE